MRHRATSVVRVFSGVLLAAFLASPSWALNCTGQAPTVSSNLSDGVKEVSGRIGPITAAASHTCTAARVELWLLLVAVAKGGDGSWSESLGKSVDDNGNQRKTLLGTATPKDGEFDIKLSDPLVGGQTIFLTEIITDTATGGAGGETDPENVVFSDPIRVSTFGSWGLVRAYFTSGLLLSQDQGSFSQSNLFLAFTLDKTWSLPGYKNADGSLTTGLKWPAGINSFFETRLTSIPVNSCAQPSGSMASAGSSGCAASTSSTGTTSTLDTFLANRKSARLDVGAYFPVTMNKWTYRGTPNSLFLAPLAKIGFDTPVGALSQTQPSNTSSASVTGSTVIPVNTTNFYKFYTFGGRLGHYALTTSKDEAPDTLSYLDFTFGRFSNLESLVLTPSLNNSRERLWRISVEGILKVPSTPLIIGFNANVGMNNPGAPKIIQGAGDDLRFLFGARFDVAKLLAHVQKVAP